MPVWDPEPLSRQQAVLPIHRCWHLCVYSVVIWNALRVCASCLSSHLVPLPPFSENWAREMLAVHVGSRGFILDPYSYTPTGESTHMDSPLMEQKAPPFIAPEASLQPVCCCVVLGWLVHLCLRCLGCWAAVPLPGTLRSHRFTPAELPECPARASVQPRACQGRDGQSFHHRGKRLSSVMLLLFPSIFI